MNYQAAIFDMDGLLLDTERVCQQAFRDACEFLSLPFLEDTYLAIIGCNAVGIEKIITAGYGHLISYETLRKEWMSRYNPIVKTEPIPVKEGVVELLNWLKANQIPMAVATSTGHELAKIKLKFAGLYDYFEHLSTGCEVEQGKPHPEIFLLAAKRLNVAPESCLAFEDSNNGVRSAVAANMQVFQIPDLVAPCTEVLAFNHVVKSSLSEALQHIIKHDARSQGTA
ncbi:MAG: HAD family phosphatase [Psychromonas sp.]|nr:HAD family phosphatase [Alteromonadales bacterium]MCP5076575.1 HAD family phosphatase [Psychromonas sp.]